MTKGFAFLKAQKGEAWYWTWRFLAYYEGGFIYAAAKEGVSNREPDLLDKCGIVVLTHDAGAFVLMIAS